MDQPLFSAKNNRRFENFTRVETFGSPDTHWIKVTVDPADAPMFSFKAEIVASNLGPPSRAHARARSKNYAYQNWKAHLSGALRPDCGLTRLWEPQNEEYARTRARVF